MNFKNENGQQLYGIFCKDFVSITLNFHIFEHAKGDISFVLQIVMVKGILKHSFMFIKTLAVEII
jgi:hypothetical protein